jgi:hypothetical protein
MRRQGVCQSYAAKLDFSSPLFSAQASGVGASLVTARWSVCRPAALLPPLPGLLFAEAIGSAVCASAPPIRMRLAWRAH